VAHDYVACSDAELLKLHVDGDSDAFGDLFLRHKDRLWAVAIRTLSDPEEAADALFGCLKGQIIAPADFDFTAPVLEEPIDAAEGILHR